MAWPLEHWQAYASSGRDGVVADPLLDVPLRPTVAELAALRADWSEGVVAVAIEAARARHRAVGKLRPEWVDRLIADEEGVMVASSSIAAQYKAERFAEIGDAETLDLCCGIGADAFELVRSGCAVTAIDNDPTRAWMAETNAQCEALVEDASSPAMLERVAESVIHLDPGRRVGSKRTHRYEDYQPGPETIARLVTASKGACVKLGPGVDFGQLPSPPGSYVELLSENGRLTQALLWSGSLATRTLVETGERVATMLPANERFSAKPGPLIDADRWYDSDGPERPSLECVYEADPALERAGLLGPFAERHGLRPIHPAVGVLTGERVDDSRWLSRFAVLDAMPWRRKAVRARLREFGAGLVTVKTRAKLVDPDSLQKELRGSGNEALTVFVLRLGDKATAIIARREAALG